MLFKLNEEQIMVKEIAKSFSEKEISPMLSDIMKSSKYPRRALERAGKLNLTGILIPEEYGGMGLGPIEYTVALEEISKVCASFAASMVPTNFVAKIIMEFGTKQQKEKYLPELANGNKLASFAVTEASGGSNWFMTNQSKATLNGDNYVLNGTKSFISNAGDADVYVVIVRTDETKGPMGFSAFIIDRDTKGFSIGTLEDKIGLHGYSTGELIYKDCSIPKENLLGREGDGLNIFQCGGNLQCIGVGAVSLGICQAALNETIKYAKEKIYMGDKSISHLENVQVAVSEMLGSLESSRLLMYKAANEMNGPTLLPVLACMNCVKNTVKVTGKAIELHGGYGSSNDYNVSRYFLDSKTLSVQMTYDQMMAIMGKFVLEVPNA